LVIRVPDQRTLQGGYAALDDRLLVLDFQAGHPEAFVEIHRRYGALARHVCQRFLPNPADADEAFQETMIRVFQGLFRFNGRYALRPWIARIAKNVALDVLRGRARRPQVDGGELVDVAEDRDEADLIVERLVQRDTVLEVLADLPETHRRALVLREIDGASHKEIAEELRITPPQAKALLHRARLSFRKRWLEKRVGESDGLRALAALPLFFVLRMLDQLRRLFDRAGHAAGQAAQNAQAAVPEAVTTTVTTSVPAAASMAERVIAAGMTIIVAGGVTVGAAKIVQNRGKPATAEVAAAAAVVAEAAPTEPDPGPADEIAPRDRETVVEPVLVEPAPSEVPGPSVEPVPSEVPSPTVEPSPTEAPPPSPSPTEDPPPTPAPPPTPPAYGFAFSISPEFSGLCPCLLIASRTGTSIAATETGGLAIHETLDGRAVAGGEDAYDLWLEYDALVEEGSGSLTSAFYVQTPGGDWYAYRIAAGLASATATEHGTDYTFEGSFQLQNQKDAVTDEVPVSGSATVTIRVWEEGELVLYGASFALKA
jgi:RNA polymerase sigma factor (sigma-70 family)